MRSLLSCFMLLSQVAFCSASVRLPALFSDGMVLQKDKPVRIWGWASPGEQLSVSIANQNPSAVADASGRWQVVLDAIPLGDPIELLIVDSAGARTVVKDVLMGEVWICSGQSNMEFPVRRSATSQPAALLPANPKLRLFRLAKVPATAPEADCKGKWVESSPATIASFSAVGFYFGHELQSTLNVPIGLIQSSWGGTPAEAWTSDSALRSVPALQSVFERAEAIAKTIPEAEAKYAVTLKDHEVETARARSENRPPPPTPRVPAALQPEKRPSTLFNGMIAPIAGYTARGVIWYQGEGNALRPKQYQTLLPTMIRNWREVWGDDTLPFGIVQLPNYGRATDDAVDDHPWPAQRESQAIIARDVPLVDAITTIDVGQTDDIHPIRKAEVGHRLANWARAKIYGHADVIWSGPQFRGMKSDGQTLRLQFDTIAPINGSNTTVTGFAIAGEDRKFVKATAHVSGSEVIVSAPGVDHPVAVRYAWKDSPDVSIAGSTGLPLAPFRSDDWPLIEDVMK